jgi:hypothetical protein
VGESGSIGDAKHCDNAAKWHDVAECLFAPVRHGREKGRPGRRAAGKAGKLPTVVEARCVERPVLVTGPG